MQFIDRLIRLVDRDVNRWAGRSLLIVLAVLPILLLDMLYPGRPADAPVVPFWIALAVSAVIGLFILWREIAFHIREWRELQDKARHESE